MPAGRALRRGAGVLLAIGAAVIAALLLAPGLGSVQRLLGHMSPRWLAIAVVLETGSCLGFVAVLRSLFGLPRAQARRLGWAQFATRPGPEESR